MPTRGMLARQERDADKEPTPYVGDPWDRQPGETPAEYQAFCIYRDLNSTERSTHKAEVGYREARNLKIPDRLISGVNRNASGWFRNVCRWNRWVERVTLWDAYIDNKETAARKRARVQAATRHAERASKVAETMAHPIDKYADRLSEVTAGLREDQLDKMTDEDLIQLGRAAARTMIEAQKEEREALGVEVEPTVVKAEERRMKGEVLRRVLAERDVVGILEKVSFELSAGERTEERAG